MSDSHISDDWWLLLKDFTFPNHFSSDYLNSVSTRLNQAKAGKLNIKSYMGKGDNDHYNKRKNERYKPNQKIKHKGFGKHTPEDVANIMANDLLHAHPELLEAMQSEIPAPDPKYGETRPSMQFHLFNTDDAVTDSKYGLINQFNPVFVVGKDGKVGLKTVFGRQSPASVDRHTIRITSSDSPAPSQSNTHIHEDLPSRFDFREAEPDLSRFEQKPIEERMPIPDSRHAELSNIFYNIPEGLHPQVLQSKNIDAKEFNQWKIDNKLASEPMDIAWRLLKEDIRDYFNDDDGISPNNEFLRYKFDTDFMPLFEDMNERQKEVAQAALDLPSDYLREEGWDGGVYQHLFTEGHEQLLDHEYEQAKHAIKAFGEMIRQKPSHMRSQEELSFLEDEHEHPEHLWSKARRIGETAAKLYSKIDGFDEKDQMKYTGEPMDIAMRLLKRQTELGEFHPDFPSSYGPVTEYHGTMDMPGVMRTGIDPPAKKRSKKHYPVEMRQNIPEKVTYTSPDREAVEQFLQRRAQQLGIPKESTGIVGVRATGLDEPATQVESGFGGDDMLTHVRAGGIPRDRLVPM